MTRIAWRFAVVASVAAVLLLVGGKRPRRVPHAPVVRAGIPILFETNAGQTDESVRFLARARGHTLFVTERAEAVLKYKGGFVKMSLVGANESPVIEGAEKQHAKANYFIGRDRSKWRTNVPMHQRVVCRAVYPGIDLVYYSRGGQLEFDFIVAPGADPSIIEMEFSEDVELDARGGLRVGAMRHARPFIHQEGERVEGGFDRRDDRRVGFTIGTFDATRPLVIDPVIGYTTLLGGSADERTYDLAVDAAGNAYIVGSTPSTNFPGAPAPAGGHDAFVAKISPDGTTLEYAAIVGGAGRDVARGVAVDATGRAYVVGETSSGDLPATGLDGSLDGENDGFLAVFAADGSSLSYLTYVGGSERDGLSGVAIDGDGNAHFVGATTSDDFPLVSIADPDPRDLEFLLVGKLDPFDDELDHVFAFEARGALTGVAVDADGAAYFCGFAGTVFLPAGTPAPIRSEATGNTEGILGKVGPDGAAMEWFSFIGAAAPANTVALDIAVDAEGSAVVVGGVPDGLSTLNAVQPVPGGNGDAFVAKVNAAGTAFEFVTNLGGSGGDVGEGVTIDLAGNIHVSGRTESDNFPLARAVQSVRKGGRDAFVARLSPDGSVLDFSSYLGGTAFEFDFNRVGVDAAGHAFVSGFTQSEDIPGIDEDSFQSTIAGSFDAYVAKIEHDADEDGLPDVWEEVGYYAANGQFVDLPGMGANPLRKTIFIEIDYMDGHKPSQQALDLIKQAFADAPVANPVGKPGIDLLIMVDDEVPFTEFLGSETTQDTYDWSGEDGTKTYFQQIKDAHFTEDLKAVSRYCLFAHRIDFGSSNSFSGISRGDADTGFAGSDFIVSLGDPEVGVGGVGSIAQQAGTFMHELGHSLGLRHGGNEDVQGKPNYISVMNYYFQFGGVCPGASPCFDFSREKLDELDENKLVETVGVGAASGLRTAKQTGTLGAVIYFDDASGAIDWNKSGGDAETAAYALDLNGDNKPIGPRLGSKLKGFDDWSALKFKGGNIGAVGSDATLPPPPAATEPPPEIDEEVFEALGPPAPTKLTGNAAKSQNVLSWKKEPSAASYHVYRTADGVAEFLGSRTQTNFQDKTAEDGVTYVYSVSSVDEDNTEGPSASVTVRTK